MQDDSEPAADPGWVTKTKQLSAVDHAKQKRCKSNLPSKLNEQKYEEDGHQLDCHFPIRGSAVLAEMWCVRGDLWCCAAAAAAARKVPGYSRCVTINPCSELPHPPTHFLLRVIRDHTAVSPPLSCSQGFLRDAPRAINQSDQSGGGESSRRPPPCVCVWATERLGDAVCSSCCCCC